MADEAQEQLAGSLAAEGHYLAARVAMLPGGPEALADARARREASRRRCEHRATRGDDPCAAPASFRVSRGRKHDAQDSCRRHLAATVNALCGEDRDTVTVKQIPGISRG